MGDNINCKALKSLWISEYDIHLTHRPLTFLDICLVCAIFCTLGVIFFNFLNLITISKYPRKPRNITDIHGYVVLLCFSHSVSVNYSSEHVDGFVNRRARESNVSSVRKSFSQVLGKTVCDECSEFLGIRFFVLYFQLTSYSSLRAVCFVAETNYV